MLKKNRGFGRFLRFLTLDKKGVYKKKMGFFVSAEKRKMVTTVPFFQSLKKKKNSQKKK
jgi:hypothetical protein